MAQIDRQTVVITTRTSDHDQSDEAFDLIALPSISPFCVPRRPALAWMSEYECVEFAIARNMTRMWIHTAKATRAIAGDRRSIPQGQTSKIWLNPEKAINQDLQQPCTEEEDWNAKHTRNCSPNMSPDNASYVIAFAYSQLQSSLCLPCELQSTSPDATGHQHVFNAVWESKTVLGLIVCHAIWSVCVIYLTPDICTLKHDHRRNRVTEALYEWLWSGHTSTYSNNGRGVKLIYDRKQEDLNVRQNWTSCQTQTAMSCCRNSFRCGHSDLCLASSNAQHHLLLEICKLLITSNENIGSRRMKGKEEQQTDANKSFLTTNGHTQQQWSGQIEILLC